MFALLTIVHHASVQQCSLPSLYPSTIANNIGLCMYKSILHSYFLINYIVSVGPESTPALWAMGGMVYATYMDGLMFR